MYKLALRGRGHSPQERQGQQRNKELAKSIGGIANTIKSSKREENEIRKEQLLLGNPDRVILLRCTWVGAPGQICQSRLCLLDVVGVVTRRFFVDSLGSRTFQEQCGSIWTQQKSD